MGDSLEGSSAAQSAQDQEEPGQRGGFFGRLFNALSQNEPAEDNAARPAGTPRAPAAGGLTKLRRLRVSDVAIPKAEITAVPVDISKDDLIAVFREHGFSRLPVYEDTLDKPLGVLLLKDMALRYGFNGSGEEGFDLRAMLRPVLYAPPSMPLSHLLQKMKSERTHMALVIDEYGGVDGLVTFEDLIEEVIGEVDDEHDTEEGGLWVREKPGIYLVQARAPLDEFEREIGMSLASEDEEDEVDTLGGLVFLLSGRVPSQGEVITHESGTEFEVVEAEARRILLLRVRLPAAAAAAT